MGEKKVEKPKFIINPVIINKWEKELNIEFAPNVMKAYINKNLADSKTWDLKKTNNLSKVRIKYGSDFHKSVPTIGHEHIFPDCDDPELLLKCLNDYRKEWDSALECYDEITEYTN